MFSIYAFEFANFFNKISRSFSIQDSFSILDVLQHHGSKLFVRNLTVSVLVDLLDDLLHDGLFKMLTKGKHLLDLIRRDGTSAILVEHLERSVEFVVAEEILLIHGGDHELRVVDLTIAVRIDLCKHFIDLLVGQVLAEVIRVPVFNFILGKFSVTISIHGTEDLVNVFLLLLGQELGGDESVSGLLQLRLRVEVLEVLKGTHSHVSVQVGLLQLIHFLDPRVLKGLLGGRTLILIFCEQLCDEVFGLVRHLTPDSVLEGELAELDLLHDLLVRGAVEWRDTREHDVGDDTARPNIALWAVVFGEHLWSNVVRSSQFFVEFFVLVED